MTGWITPYIHQKWEAPDVVTAMFISLFISLVWPLFLIVYCGYYTSKYFTKRSK